MTDFRTITYTVADTGVARIVLSRPEAANAQNREMLYELSAAFDRAAQDNGVRVVILAGAGKHFSAGHDLRDRAPMSDFEPVGCCGGFDLPGAEGWMATEQEIYLGLCWRWRNFPKATIAEVQGKVILGGLMLAWVCDLIVASEDAEFSDTAVSFGMNGGEFFVHQWEMGTRLAKEMLFTGEPITAHRAYEIGMINRVVPREELSDTTEALARRIAAQPTMGIKLAKQSVHDALDAQNQWTAVSAAFGRHQLGHSHNMQVHGMPIDPAGLRPMRRNG